MNSSAHPEPTARPSQGAGSVLHLITRLDRGGSADNTLSTSIGLAERGWNVTLAYGVTREPAPLLERASRTTGLTLMEVPDLVRPISPRRDLRAYRFLRRLARSGRDWDVVHTHTSKAGLLGRRAWWGLSSRIVHTPHGHVFHGYFGPLLSRMAVAVERRAAHWCHRIVVLTDRGRREHLAAGVGRRSQYVTIPSGVDLERFERVREGRQEARRVLGIPESARVVGTVARLVEIKGIRYLVEAAADLAERHPGLGLLVVGDGDQRTELEAIAASGPLRGRAVFTGALEDPGPALAAMDVFCMPSLNEGQGRAVVEAMAASLPVVAADVGGLPEVLDGGGAGLLVPPASPAPLAAALERMLSQPGAARDLATAAGRRIRGRYDTVSMVDAIEALYRKLPGRGGER